MQQVGVGQQPVGGPPHRFAFGRSACRRPRPRRAPAAAGTRGPPAAGRGRAPWSGRGRARRRGRRRAVARTPVAGSTGSCPTRYRSRRRGARRPAARRHACSWWTYSARDAGMFEPGAQRRRSSSGTGTVRRAAGRQVAQVDQPFVLAAGPSVVGPPVLAGAALDRSRPPGRGGAAEQFEDVARVRGRLQGGGAAGRYRRARCRPRHERRSATAVQLLRVDTREERGLDRRRGRGGNSTSRPRRSSGRCCSRPSTAALRGSWSTSRGSSSSTRWGSGCWSAATSGRAATTAPRWCWPARPSGCASCSTLTGLDAVLARGGRPRRGARPRC